MVSDTLQLSGSDYFVGGSGYFTRLLWRGKPGGTTIEVCDPDRLTLENIMVGHHDSGPANNAIDIAQIGTGKPSSMTYDRVWIFGMYQNKPLERGLRLENLGKGDQVYVHEANGNIHCTDCAQATIYLGVSYEGTILLEGKSPKRDGFIGGSVRLGTATDPALWLKDNQSFVISDFYVESSTHYLRMEGDATLPPGRATLGGAKLELIKPENNLVEVTNYRGELVLGPYQFYPGNPLHRFVQQGNAPFSLTLLGDCFYNDRPDFKLATTTKPEILGCYGACTDQAHANDLPDAAFSEALISTGHALDDLRRLGAVDMKINYPFK